MPSSNDFSGPASPIRCCARRLTTAKTGSRNSAISWTSGRAASSASATSISSRAIRAEIPHPAELVYAKVTDIEAGGERQTLTLSNGETISARLAVLANGLNVGLRRKLGIERQITSACHSISIGFDLVPVGRPAFDFPAMTYFSERTSDRIPYLTLFPVGSTMRANLFTYREIDDPWLREMRRRPVETMNAALPRLHRFTGEAAVAGDVKIRPVDLYVSTGYRQAGIVLVGDAFAATCPVTGTGTDKVLTDVTQLCNVHIPNWLATEGMGEDKIASFYDDPVKQACDAWSSAQSFSFRKVTLDDGLYWEAQRWARFLGWLGQGTLRRARNRLSGASKLPPGRRQRLHCPSIGAAPRSRRRRQRRLWRAVAAKACDASDCARPASVRRPSSRPASIR